MPMYDYVCSGGHQFEALEPITNREIPCRLCDHPAERVWTSRAPYMVADTVVGGFWIENLNPTPTWFPSKSAYAQELKRQGKEIGARWVSTEYSDKPPNGLSRWY